MLNIIIGKFLNQSIKAFASISNLMEILFKTLKNYISHKTENFSEILSKYSSKKILSGKKGVILTSEGKRMMVDVLSEL